MPRGKTKDRDGIYQRKDRPGFWASWVDASGKRRQRKLEAYTLQQARALLSAEKARVEKTVTLGYAPPSVETFLAVSERFLKHQRARLTPRSYDTRKAGHESAPQAILWNSEDSQKSAAPMCRDTLRIAAATFPRLPS